MEKATRIELEQDEMAVMHAASRIFAGYIANGQVTAENEKELLGKAIDLAVTLAKEVDIRVSAGKEVRSTLRNDPNYRPLG